MEFEIVELPSETTDYYIDEYDGYNQLIYVVDGKLNNIIEALLAEEQTEKIKEAGLV